MPRRRRLLVVVALGCLLAAAVAFTSAVRNPPAAPLAARVDAVATELRCPVCAGETVAESQSDVAVAMRAEIADQLARGRSDAQVREWFAQRYGADVVLRPASAGAGLVVWLLPGIALGVGVLVVAARVGGSRRRLVPAAVALTAVAALAAPVLLPSEADQPRVVAAEDVQLDGLRAAASAGDASSWAALGQQLSGRGRHTEAVDAYRSALQAGVDEQALRLPLGLSLVHSGRPDEALPLLRDAVAADPDDPEALLVLAAALRDTDPDEARSVLERFLAVAPDHAGAPGVRRALGEEDR